jgi:hypothetical protein
MRAITEHEFIRHTSGTIALLLDAIAFEEAKEPVLLVSRSEEKAYLRRSEGDVHEISDINPKIIGDVRKADRVVILELLGEEVKHRYAVPTGILEDGESIGEARPASLR